MNNKLSISLVASFFLATNLFSANQLETITITSATKSTQSIKDVTSNVEVITKEDIEERHFTTIAEALNTLPGISYTSNGGLGKSSSIFMRGFDNQRILVLIDGINYNDYTGISGARLEHLMINNVEQIEVIKGAQSGIWGADANAGVINIITSSAKKGTYVNTTIEAGSYNTKKISASVSNRTENYDIKLSVTKLISDGFTTRVPLEANLNDFEKDGYKNTTLNLKAGLNLNEKNRIEVNHTIINSKSEYDNTVYTQTFSVDQVATANSSGDELRTKNSYSSLNYTNKNNFSDIKIYTNYSKINRDDPTGSTKEFDGTLKEFGSNIIFPYSNQSSFVQLGVDKKITNHKNDVNKELNNEGIFATNSIKFNNTIFTQSLRHDKYDLFNDKTTGKIGIKHYIRDNLSLTTNYGTSYNVPTFYKLYNSFAGYSNLQPESTKSKDVSLEYKGLSFTYFYNKINNMIEYNSNTYKYYNLSDDVTIKGYEIGYKKDLIEDIFFGITYTKLSAKDEKNMDLQRRSKDSVKLNIDYYGNNKLHVNVNGEYVGDRKEYDFGTYNIKAQTGRYTLWNSVINYEINKTFSTYLKIDNLFDKQYQTVDGYATAPRSAYVGLKATF